jgi:pyrroline-5-carboxylate reductase
MKIGFIGAGKMAQALARGLIQSGRYEPSKIIASCPRIDVKLLDEIKVI